MSTPAFVGAGTGAVITTGTGTVTKTDCVMGNVLFLHLYEDNASQQWTRSNRVNVEAPNGVDNADNIYQSGLAVGNPQVGNHALLVGRVMANGTCSWDLTVGAAGGDISARIYEFTGVNSGRTFAEIAENVGGSGGGRYINVSATNTNLGDAAVVTGLARELALNFVVLQGSQALGNLTGETGGDWTEAVAEYSHATGNGCTLQLQTGEMLTAGTIDGGTMAIASAPWAVVGIALRPEVVNIRSQSLDYDYPR